MRRAAVGGEGSARHRGRDLSADTPGFGDELVDFVLPNMLDLHAVLATKSGGRWAGGLRAHGRVEEGRDILEWEVPFQGHAFRSRFLLDQGDLPDS